MIYVSSSCVQNPDLRQAVTRLAEEGISRIELTAGFGYIENIETVLKDLTKRLGVNFIFHNYFPPSPENFVINLASTDEAIYEKSIAHLSQTIALCQRLGITQFGFHAGFFTDIPLQEIGGVLNYRKLAERKNCLNRFCDAYQRLSRIASGSVRLYVENNVFSSVKHRCFGHERPFMLLTYDDYLELKGIMDFNLLLDVGHLKVTCQTLFANYETELTKMAQETEYFHLSDNNGLLDQHVSALSESKMRGLVGTHLSKAALITIETTDGVEQAKKMSDWVKRMVSHD